MTPMWFSFKKDIQIEPTLRKLVPLAIPWQYNCNMILKELSRVPSLVLSISSFFKANSFPWGQKDTLLLYSLMLKEQEVSGIMNKNDLKQKKAAEKVFLHLCPSLVASLTCTCCVSGVYCVDLFLFHFVPQELIFWCGLSSPHFTCTHIYLNGLILHKDMKHRVRCCVVLCQFSQLMETQRLCQAWWDGKSLLSLL